MSQHCYSDECCSFGLPPTSIVVFLTINSRVLEVKVRGEAKALSHHLYFDDSYCSRLLPALTVVLFAIVSRVKPSRWEGKPKLYLIPATLIIFYTLDRYMHQIMLFLTIASMLKKFIGHLELFVYQSCKVASHNWNTPYFFIGQSHKVVSHSCNTTYFCCWTKLWGGEP